MSQLKYFPFGKQFDLKMGTSFFTPEDNLIEIDDHYTKEIALKRETLNNDHRYYYRSAAGFENAQWEVLDLVLSDMSRSHPHLFELTRNGDEWRWMNNLNGDDVTFEFGNASTLPYEPLDWVGRQVQEDLVILGNDPGTSLVAGQLCFANGFSLDDKHGQPFLTIHAPAPRMVVPTMDAAQKLIERLPPLRSIWRASWNFKISDELDLTSRHNARYKSEMDRVSPTLTGDNIGQRLFIRIERQTLTKLPNSGCILFGIHTYINLLGNECTDKERAGCILKVLQSTPREMLDYKAVTPFESALVTYLTKQSTAT